MSKIIRLEAENFKRLKAVRIAPNGDLVEVSGRNAQGKSSVLDAIEAALGGERSVPAVPVKTGADKARIVVELDDIVVTREFRGSKSTLVVATKEGAQYKSPQAMLDALVGRLTFDPLSFMRSKDQAAVLRKVVGLDVTALDAKRRNLYEERTVVGREGTLLKGQVEGMFVPHAPEPLEPIDVRDIESKAEAAERKHKDLEAAESSARARLASAQRRQENAAKEVSAIGARIQSLEAELAMQRKALEDERQEAIKADADLETTKAALDEARNATRPDVASLRHAVLEAMEHNGKVAQVEAERRRAADAEQAKARRTADLDAKRAEYAGLTAAIDAIDADKTKMLQEAATRMPIEGLGVDGEVVTLEGLPLDQASSAQQLRVSLAIAEALNPKLRVVLIRDGSLLDDESMAALGAWATERHMQVWLERVGTGGTGVVIEDGEVV